MKIIVCVILLLYGLVMLLMCYIAIFPKEKKSKNKVHFYVARDMDGVLYIYPTKPIRRKCCFIPNYSKGTTFTFTGFNGHCLNTRNFDNLEWEDGPVEVFVNMED